MLSKAIQKIIQSTKILFHPKGGFKYLTKPSSSIASFNMANSLASQIPDLGYIIDVGANIGQFAVAINQIYPKAKVYSFEPVPETFLKLEANVKGLAAIIPYNCALGDSVGDIKFYKNDYSHASSALTVSDFQKNNLPFTEAFSEISVKCSTLDEFHFDITYQKPLLLKLDVQGFELNVLKGGMGFLKDVEYILLEVSFIAMYSNEPLFDEINTFLNNIGFRIIAPIGSLQIGEDRPIPQLDMLYRKI